MAEMEYAIWHDWQVPGKEQSWTGEFVYLGTLDECVDEMRRQKARHPNFVLSLHCMDKQIRFETPDEKFLRTMDPTKVGKVMFMKALPGAVGRTGPGKRRAK